MKRRKNIKILAGVLLMMVCFSGCIRREEDDKVDIGYFNNVTHAQALYMKAEGILEKAFGEEHPVTWTAFNAGPAEVEALFSASIDIGYIGPVPAVTANVQSEGDLTILSGAAMAGAELVKAKGVDIETIGDLAGKKVAIPQIGNTQHLCLLKLLADHGLSTVEDGGNVTVTAVENADVLNMMDQGNIDAALVPEPWGATLVANGAEIVLDYDEVYRNGDYPVTVVIVRNDFLKAHPDLVRTFLQKHEEVTAHIAENPEETTAIINNEINEATGKSLDAEILESAFEKIILSTAVSEEAMKDFADICLEQRFVTKKITKLFAELEEDENTGQQD